MVLTRLPIAIERCLDIARRLPGVADIEKVLIGHLARQKSLRGVIIVANDWMTLPAAIEAKRRFGVPFHYDTHELALAEHSHRLLWRLLFPPLVFAVERLGLQHAQSASCVGPSIRQRMLDTYNLGRPPGVVMNIPDGQRLAPRPVGELVQVLYHGLFKENRGLESLLKSAAQWRPHLQLVLRGRAHNRSFEQRLRDLSSSLDLSSRVIFEPSVSQSDVISAANSADIGVFLPDIRSPQNRYALPNKVFEYLHAGLMVVVPANTDMATVVEPFGAGVGLVDSDDPQALADLLNGMSREDIFVFKQCAHTAAAEFTWRIEEDKFLALITSRGALQP